MFGSKKKYIIWFVVIVFLIAATSQAYASEITSVSGQISHDSTNVIISGSGFGQKIPAEPYFYDNFESGADGDDIVGKSGTVGTTAWLEYMRRGSPQYSDSSSYGKGTLAAHKTSSGNDFMTAGIDGLLSENAYLSYNYKWSATLDNWEDAVYKLSRITSQGGLYSETPSVFPQYQPGKGWAYDGYNPGEGGPGNFSFTAPEQDIWHRAEIYMKLSNPAGANNGEVQTRYNNEANIDEKDVLTRTASKSDKLLDSFILPFDIANNLANTYSFWADDVYFDITRARVEICDTPTWQSRTHCDIQIPTSWSDDGTSVGITVNQGEFSSEEPAYLYVIDSNDIVSNDGNGHPITITD